MEELSAERVKIVAEAADWLVRLEEDSNGGCQQPFRTWVTSSKVHVEEFLLISALQHELRHLNSGHVLGLLPDLEEQPVPVAPASRERSRYRGAIAAAVVAVLLAMYGLWPREPTPSLVGSRTTYVTGANEQRVIELETGATMRMNAQTRTELTSTTTEREITLVNGEVLFVLTSPSHKPLRVTSGTRLIQDIGTRFDVRRGQAATTLTVAEGRVLLSTGCSSTWNAVELVRRNLGWIWGAREDRPAIIGAREQVSVQDECEHVATVRKLDRDELAEAISWGEARLEFQSASIREAVDRFNRYNRRQMSAADPALADIRIGGSFWASDVDSFLSVLNERFHIKGTRSVSGNGDEVIQLSMSDCRQKRLRCNAAENP
jgi:transmembrane sensor